MRIRSNNPRLDLAHYLVVVLALSSPFWLSWKYLMIIVIIYSLSITKILGYCPLTRCQYGSTDTGFVERHILKLSNLLNINISKPLLQNFLRYGLPVILIILAWLIQR